MLVQVRASDLVPLSEAERRRAVAYALVHSLAHLALRDEASMDSFVPALKHFDRFLDGSSTRERLGVPADMPIPSVETPRPDEDGGDEEDEDEDPREIVTLTVEYALEGWGSPEDLEKRHKIEGLLHAALWKWGAGYVDGGEIGSGSMSVFCGTRDPEYAEEIIRDTLANASLDEGARIFLEE